MDDRQRALNRQNMETRRGAAIIDGTNDEFRADSYTNMLNKYGTAQDNSESYRYQAEDYESDMDLIRQYESNGLFAKIIDRPAEEAVKHGYDIDFGDSEITEYFDTMLDKLDLESKFTTAEKWARLFGGAIIVMLVDDGRGLDEPLDWENVRRIEELQVFERAVVQPDYTSMYYFGTRYQGDNIREPEFYQISSLYGYFRVHKSRCLIFRNGELPEQTSSTNYRFFGIPEYIRIKRELRECLTSHGYGVKLLERCVQAIYKMKNLANMLATDQGEDKVLQRLQIIDMARSIMNSIAIDGEGEEYDFRTATMSGVKEVLDATCNMLSAVTNIPQTILFGRSPAGENSTGESDLENYYNMVESIQKQNMKRNSRIVFDLIFRQGVYEGEISEIPKYKVKFAALWSMTDAEQASVEQMKAQTEYTKAQTAQVYMDGNVLDPVEIRQALAKDGAFEIDEVLSDNSELNLPDDTFSISIQDDEPVAGDGMIRIHSDRMDTGERGAAVLVIKDGKILCGTRDDDGTICGPGGHVEDGEPPDRTATREAQEEFSITPLYLLPLGHYKGSTGRYLPSTVYFTDQFTGDPVADEDEMHNARWLTLRELENETLFPPFAESLNMLKNSLTSMDQPDTIKSDGGPGSGRYPKGSGKKNSGTGRERKKSLPMTTVEKAKVTHDINNLYHAKFKGKRKCFIRTRSNEPDSPTYTYRFANHGFNDYDIYSKEWEE